MPGSESRETMRTVLIILLAASTVAFAQTGLAPPPDPPFAPELQPEPVPLVCSNSFGQVVPCDPAMPPPELDLEPAPPPTLTCMNMFGQVVPCPQ
jgi:hypothetical protein